MNMLRWLEAIGWAVAAALAFFGFGVLKKRQGALEAEAQIARAHADQVTQIDAHLAKADEAAATKEATAIATHVAEGAQLSEGDHLGDLLAEADEINRARTRSPGPGNEAGTGASLHAPVPAEPTGKKNE